MTRYQVDPAATRVWIEARSSLHPIRSESDALAGHLSGTLDADGVLDPQAPAEAVLELPLDALTSGNPVYDGEMRRRVDARRYPSITAVLTSLRAGSPAGRYVAEGDVTFRGVTRRVTGDLTISPAGPGALRFEGEHVFNLRDFGMEPPRILMLRVFPEVTVRVRIVMTAGD